MNYEITPIQQESRTKNTKCILKNEKISIHTKYALLYCSNNLKYDSKNLKLLTCLMIHTVLVKVLILQSY